MARAAPVCKNKPLRRNHLQLSSLESRLRPTVDHKS